MTKIFYLYAYTNKQDGKRYIGVTFRPAQRAAEHAAAGKYSSRVFSKAVKKHGFDAFDYKVLALFDDADAAAYHEQAAISKFGTLAPDGYNLFRGAPYTRYAGTPSAETRQKLSEANQRVYAGQEVRDAISKKLKANWADPEVRARRIATLNTPEVSAKIHAGVSERTRSLWADPVKKAERSAAIKAGWARRHARLAEESD